MKALLRYIQDVKEDKFIKSLIDEYTNLLTGDIPTILDYLFNNYSKVHSKEVSQKEMEVISMIQQRTNPIVLLTRLLEQLQKLVVQAGIQYTGSQILEKGLVLVRVTRDFKYTLMQQEDKNETNKT